MNLDSKAVGKISEPHNYSKVAVDADSKEDKDNANIIFYDAETQFENLGDLLINRILLRKLRNFGSLCINLAAVPSWYQEKIEALPSESLDEGNGKFENRVFWIGMRSLFNPNLNVYLVQIPGHYSGGVRGRALKKILYFLLLKLVGVRICRLGTSIGAFSKDRARLEKWQSRFMHYYSVRDSLSQQYAQEIGIRKPRFFPDLAWLVTPCSMEALSSIEKREYVILSFREVNFGSETSLDYQNCFWATLDNVIDQVANELSMKIVVSYQVKRDYTFSKKIFDRYADTYNIHFMESKIDDDSMNSIYSASYMTFSNRLHVLMMSMAYGSLPVGVINPDEHSKILGIFHDSKLEHLILNMYESEQVAQRMNDILASTHTLRQSIVELYSSNQKISKRLLAEVFDEAEVAA